MEKYTNHRKRIASIRSRANNIEKNNLRIKRRGDHTSQISHRAYSVYGIENFCFYSNNVRTNYGYFVSKNQFHIIRSYASFLLSDIPIGGHGKVLHSIAWVQFNSIKNYKDFK